MARAAMSAAEAALIILLYRHGMIPIAEAAGLGRPSASGVGGKMRGILVLGACLLTAAPALAVTSYHYSGQISPDNSRDGGITSYVDEYAPFTFDFNVSSPLIANLTFVNIADLGSGAYVTSWTASAGSAVSTSRSSDADAMLTRLILSTDGQGRITYYSIRTDSTAALLPGITLEYTFQSIVPLDSVNFIQGGLSRGSALCNHCGARGTFEQVAADVPEPATWGTMLVGFGLIGGLMRRRESMLATA